MTYYNVIIVGAGAAGLMCAIEAGKRGRKVLVLDHSKIVGEKIRISGGGRCNFTNIHASPAYYISRNPYFCVSALARYTQHDFIELVASYKIAYHEKTLGQLFCDDSSKHIINMLLKECELAGVTIQLNSKLLQVSHNMDKFQVKLNDGVVLTSTSLVIATGGPSIPKIGGTGWGYDIAKQFGLKVIDPYPALVPFLLEGDWFKVLSGISVDVEVACNGQSFREAMLFTHRGLSGPAILQISSYWQEGNEICINFYPDGDMFVYLKDSRERTPKKDIATVLGHVLPKKFVQYVCESQGYKGTLADLSNKRLQEIADYFHTWTCVPSGTEGYRTAEVTAGGVDTDELLSKTCESKKVPSLYFIGEVVDVTGHLGGFNFQWAWSSGYIAGQVV